MERVTQILTLLRDPRLDLDALGDALDAAHHEERMAFLRELTPKLQQRLFEAAQGRPVRLTDMVPQGTPPLRPIIHEGQNTLPSFRRFQKRFCLPERQDAARPFVVGYNHQTFSPVTGPGYFSAYEHEGSGELWIDYRELPQERPQEWPRIIANHKKLGLLVYHGMVDRMRRVSSHVTVGRAYKKDAMNAWFTLVRRP